MLLFILQQSPVSLVYLNKDYFCLFFQVFVCWFFRGLLFHKNMELAAIHSLTQNVILTLAKDPLTRYIEEFLKLSHLVTRSEGTLITCFWIGLNDHFFQLLPVGATTCMLAQYMDYVLWLSVSKIKEDITTQLQPPQPMSTICHPPSSFQWPHQLSLLLSPSLFLQSPASLQPRTPRSISQSPPLTQSLCPPRSQG